MSSLSLSFLSFELSFFFSSSPPLLCLLSDLDRASTHTAHQLTMGSLKQFVKAVRKAKTIADERAVVRKESAAIRTAFRDPNLDQAARRSNIAKLLYLYILGEKTHFGQVECLKLLALPRFADKRLGYLATMLLLDEKHEVLTLLTNSLDNDMHHPNAFIVAQALCCLGNVALPELARDLHADVDHVLAANLLLAYLRKKAAVVAAKLVAKDPDLAEVFAPRVAQLLADKTPLVVLGACRLIDAIYTYSPLLRPAMVATLPRCTSHLRRVLAAGYMPDYDVGGVADPFLQVTLLSTIRTLACHQPCTCADAVNDVLTQVCLGVDAGKNAAHAVLYECVRTIFAVDTDQLLRVLGVNVLGRFLLQKDNNTRYVALETLLAVVAAEPLAVQRHRSTIVACLADADVLIRRRALELAFAVVTAQNVRVLMRDILAYMEARADPELTLYVASQVVVAAAAHAPTAKWHFDTLVRMLRAAGADVPHDMIASVLALVLNCTDQDLRTHVVRRVLAAHAADPGQWGLAVVAVWCVGEYAAAVVGATLDVADSTVDIDEAWVAAWLASQADSSVHAPQHAAQLTCYVLTAAAKLLVRFSNAQAVERMRTLIGAHTHDTNVEVQTRAVEYEAMFADARLRHGVFAAVPAPPLRQHEASRLQGNTKSGRRENDAEVGAPTPAADLLDLGDAPPQMDAATSDVLSDIFGGSERNGASDASQGPVSKSSASRGSVSKGSDSSGSGAAPAASSAAFANADLAVAFSPLAFTPGHAAIAAAVSSTSAHRIDHVQLLIAVPKSQKLAMSTTGSDALEPGATITQQLKISGALGSRIKLRVKVKYAVDGVPADAQFDYAGFAQTL